MSICMNQLLHQEGGILDDGHVYQYMMKDGWPVGSLCSPAHSGSYKTSLFEPVDDEYEENPNLGY